MERFRDIPGSEAWKAIKKIDEGWSTDEKYYVEDNKEEKCILRVCKANSYEKKKKEFEIIQRFNTLDFTMSKAVAFGYFNNNTEVYMLLSWVDGQALEKVIGSLPETEQYNLGLQAGRILNSIHSLEVDKCDIPSTSRIPKKLEQLRKYEESSVRIENDETALVYVKRNIEKICKSPAVYTHGDFHLGNLVYSPDGKIGVIDFNRWKCGDRYEDFYKVQSFDVEVSVPFSVGQLQGYFEGEPPMDFWVVQAVYVAHASLYSIKWAEEFGEEEINGMKRRCLDAFADYNNFNEIVPAWYLNNKNRWS